MICRVSLNSIIEFLYYSFTIEFLLLLILIKRFYLSSKGLLQCWKASLALWWMQDCHTCLYLLLNRPTKKHAFETPSVHAYILKFHGRSHQYGFCHERWCEDILGYVLRTSVQLRFTLYLICLTCGVLLETSMTATLLPASPSFIDASRSISILAVS